MDGKRKTLGQLFVPICLETLCLMLAGTVDTLMLSSVSDEAVGAVGTSNTYIGIFIIMCSVITSGMIAVMTQYIGANRIGVAYQARQMGLAFNFVIGISLSVFLFLFSDSVLEIVGVAPRLMEPAKLYLQTVGSFCFLNALIPIFSSYLRAFGHTRWPLTATLCANVLNIILNAVFLFPLQMGVQGVAIATVISRFVNLAVLLAASRFLVRAKRDRERLPRLEILAQIIRIGLPAALETALYNLAMTLIMRFLNQMDPDGMNVTARSYTMQITNFSYCAGAALAQANAIITGWRIGAGEYEACSRGTKRAAVIGILVATSLETLFALCSGFIMPLFSDNPEMVSLVGTLLAIDIVLEIGRVSNLVFGQALKTSGDAVFPTVIAVVFMYLCAVGGTYLFGIRLGLLVIGAYIGMTMDECVRALLMFLRWRSGKWKEKNLVAER